MVALEAKSERITTVITVHPERNMNVSTKHDGNPSTTVVEIFQSKPKNT